MKFDPDFGGDTSVAEHEQWKHQEPREPICPRCGAELMPTCLGCGARYACTKCNYEETCSCTDYE